MLVHRINKRFIEGKPSNNVTATGVLLRNIEGMAGRHTEAWEPCAADEFCSRSSDRLAASIVNSHMPHLFSYDAGGMVISPERAHVLCSYHGDGNNFGRFCTPPTDWLKMAAEVERDGSDCVPGCTSHFGWCDDLYHPCPLCEEIHCAWRATGVATMVEAHQQKLEIWRKQGTSCDKGKHRSRCHNEVVLDAAAWTSHMPQTLEAFFYQRRSSTSAVAEVRRLHSAFHQRYGLDAQLTPLIVYDPTSATAPFALAPTVAHVGDVGHVERTLLDVQLLSLA